jgi:hypothetical protein
MSTVLFAPADYKPAPRAVWIVSDFTDINDTVRGGSSKSSMTIVDASAGIDFTGFLDTTTLGGAGFASQSYSKGFPGSALDKEKYTGLRLIVASPITRAAESAAKVQPGGGKGPVTKYVLNLKTELPKRRPDGRSESAIVYEAAFSAPSKADGSCASVDAEWSDFKAIYRGRPAEAKPLDPSQVKEWSIMARSNFEVSVSCLLDVDVALTSYSAFRRSSPDLSLFDLCLSRLLLRLQCKKEDSSKLTLPTSLPQKRADQESTMGLLCSLSQQS